MAETEPHRTPRMGRWSRVLLAVSLALNLLVAGLVVGAMLRFGGPEGARRPPPSLAATLYRALPRDDRRAVRESMRDAPQARIQARRAGARDLAAALRRTPFDSAQVQRLVAEQTRAHDIWQHAVLAAWLARVDAMSDAERAAYAGRIEEFMSKRRRHGHDDGGRRD